MVLDQYVRDFKAFMEEFATALDSNRAKFYLDTSFLIWLIRVGAEARCETLEWLQSRPPSAVRVPVWTAHELHRHILRGTARINPKNTVDETRAKLEDFVTMAAERADDRACNTYGFANRTSFVQELQLSSVKFSQLAKVVALDDRSLQRATQEVIDFANQRMLSTNLDPIIAKLDRTAVFRTSHLVPPGFHDDKKEGNKYGDLVIWEEIVRDLRASRDAVPERRDVIFISRDQKTDWVSAAPFVLNLKGEPQKCNREEEMDVTEAHPYLVHELVGIKGGKRLYITQPGFLASVIDFGYRRRQLPTKVTHWLSASHRPDALSKLAGAALSNLITQPAQTNVPSAPSTPPAATAPPEDPLKNAVINEFITGTRPECAAYRDALPGRHDGLINDWATDVLAGTLPAAKFGRIMADLVLGRMPTFDEQIPALFERFAGMMNDSMLNDAALATITAAYFDAYSVALPRPHLRLGAVALQMEKQTRLKPAFSALNRFLKAANVELPYLPGSGQTKIKFEIDTPDGGKVPLRSIRDTRLANQSVLIDRLDEDNPRTLSKLLSKDRAQGCLGQDVRLLLSREFLVPLDNLATNFDQNKFTWQPDAGLVALDTSSPGGLAADANEENE